jgi:hypothetical protein
MGYYVARLGRPYDVRALIEAYIYAQRKDFVHADFTAYYSALLDALQAAFGVRLSEDGLTLSQRVLWKLFRSTVASLLRITSPWDCFLEAGLLVSKLDESGEPGKLVRRASTAIDEANATSRAAHREILYALFPIIFGACDRVVTSEELRRAGFDDTREPDITNYYDYF